MENNGDFMPALQAALRADKPVVIEVRTDKEHLSVAATLSEIRAGKLASKRPPTSAGQEG